MKPEKQQLIHDLLGDDRRREATLLAGARILRRRRLWRVGSRGLVFVLLPALAGLWFERTTNPKPQVETPAMAAVPPPPSQPQAFTDEQLLALFPNTPVGLITLPDGRKRLIFPHPSDEQKFLVHL
jgi:hypothetical protein